MEKRERLSDLRRGNLPEIFLQKYQSLSNLILRMTNVSIRERPNARELVRCIEDERFSLENDYVIIPNNFYWNSEDIVEYDYDIVDISCDRLDLTLVNSEFKSISVDSIYDKYDYNPIPVSCFLDYSWDYTLNSRNT
jgi:hypothetical protein